MGEIQFFTPKLVSGFSGIGLVAKLIGMLGRFPGDSPGGTQIRSNYSASNTEYFGIVLVRPMRAALVFLTLSFTAIAGSLPDDAVLSQRLVGTWRGSRHETRYFADGTWMMDPQHYELLGGQTSHGKWRIENAKLIETWRFVG